MNEKPLSQTNFSPLGTARNMGPGPSLEVHYYVGKSGNNFLTWCGKKIPKNDPGASYVRMDVELLEACDRSNDPDNKLTERKKVPCATCAEHAPIVALSNIIAYLIVSQRTSAVKPMELFRGA